MDNLKPYFDRTNPASIEILRLAKELAYSDYNNRKADLHNQWLKESDYMWKTQRLRVAYPPIPPFPTEEDIAKRAERLLDFLTRPRPDLEPTEIELPKVDEGVIAPTKETTQVAEVQNSKVDEQQSATEDKEEIKTNREEINQIPEQPNVSNKTSVAPEQSLELARLKVMMRNDDGLSGASARIPTILEKIKQALK